MKKKIIGIFLCTLMIETVLTATGAINFQTTWLVDENNYCQLNQNTPANPGIITINIVAQVKNIYDPDNSLGGAIKVNDTIKGKYTYDTNATDSNPNPTIGTYWYNLSSCGWEVKAGEFFFKTDPNNVKFEIDIGNDFVDPPHSGDIIIIVSYNNLNLSNELRVLGITWVLYDPSSTALNSTDLPTTAPVLSDWNQSTSGFGLSLLCLNSSTYTYFEIRADITKAIKSRARNVHFFGQPVLIWLLERFQNIFLILRQLMKL